MLTAKVIPFPEPEPDTTQRLIVRAGAAQSETFRQLCRMRLQMAKLEETIQQSAEKIREIRISFAIGRMSRSANSKRMLDNDDEV